MRHGLVPDDGVGVEVGSQILCAAVRDCVWCGKRFPFAGMSCSEETPRSLGESGAFFLLSITATVDHFV